jgi:D-arabinose 5-phosphate isomerase GutQ
LGLKISDRIIKELPARLGEIGESDIIMAWGKSAEEAEIKRIAEKLKNVGLEKLTSSPP